MQCLKLLAEYNTNVIEMNGGEINQSVLVSPLREGARNANSMKDY